MGRLDLTEPQGIPDCFGVQSFFVTDFFVEPAGPSEVRLIACARINGILVAQYVSVMPAASVLKGSLLVREVAMAVLQKEVGLPVH